MKIPVEYDYTKETKRWLAYFDLLGFSSHFKDQKDKANQILMAFNIYAPCLEAIKRKQQRIPELQYVWFSDSFLIYAPDDSGEMFLSMLSAYEWFFAELIRNNIPVQGALACDQFYADAERGIYLGRGCHRTARSRRRSAGPRPGSSTSSSRSSRTRTTGRPVGRPDGDGYSSPPQ